MALQRWQDVGCGKYCLECPPTGALQRLAFFRCEEVGDAADASNPSSSASSPAAPFVDRPDLARLLVSKLSPSPASRFIGAAGDFGPDASIDERVGRDWQICEEDRRMLAEYEAWLPDRVFDAHAHLWNFDYWTDELEAKRSWVASFEDRGDGARSGRAGLPSGTVDNFIQRMSNFCPGRTIGGLILNTPNLAVDGWGHSAWSAEECRRASGPAGTCPSGGGEGFFVCAMNVTPETSRADIERGVREFGYVGLKCYHFYAKGMDNTQDSEIDQYLTDEHCEAADALGLTVSLHMVKPLACSDPGNLANIRRLCTQYPKMNLILCHSARGFNMHHVIGVIDTLADLPNLYFDTGAVTEAGATNAILRSFGAQKVMYGSDWPVAESRGKCVSLGDSFIWLTPHNVDLFAKYAHNEIVAPALVGFETLRALKQACDELSLSREDISDIFWGNAVRLYGARHREFLAAHPTPLEVPAPDLQAPVAYFARNQNGATRPVSRANRL